MKIFICDDEPKMLSDIVSKVRGIVQESEIWDYTDARELLAKMDEELCDVLLLDIDMPGLDGLDVAKHLADKKKKPLLVFVTSHDELVYDSLQFHPFGFVRKSYLDKELPKVVLDCVRELGSREKHFFFKTANENVKLSLSDILYMEADGNYLKLFTVTEEYRFRDTISAVCNALEDSGFVRLHRGFLVNQAAVKMLGMAEVELINGSKIPIGRSYADIARKQLMRYMMQ